MLSFFTHDFFLVASIKDLTFLQPATSSSAALVRSHMNGLKLFERTTNRITSLLDLLHYRAERHVLSNSCQVTLMERAPQ